MKSKRKDDSGKKRIRSKPVMKWQTGDYERHAEYRFVLPYQFLLLCKLTGIRPRQVILDFLDTLDCGSSNREGRNKARDHLFNYFIETGYGQNLYSTDDIREIFREMDAIGMLFPVNAKMNLLNLHVRWRIKYHKYWYKKWFMKIRRKD